MGKKKALVALRNSTTYWFNPQWTRLFPELRLSTLIAFHSHSVGN
jgi:hypothetical protein